jgi:hypothetical protein
MNQGGIVRYSSLFPAFLDYWRYLLAEPPKVFYMYLCSLMYSFSDVLPTKRVRGLDENSPAAKRASFS